MKPIVLSLAVAVLLLISLANHRQKSCPEERFTTPVHNCIESSSDNDSKINQPASEYHHEPVTFSGKSINFFITF